MSSIPRISVVMAVHNGMPFLPAAVESVFAQTFNAFELLVIDDGSTDETPNYLQSVADPRLRFYRLDKVGFCEALNFGLRKAQAKYVARIDADDVAYPNRFLTQYEYLNSHLDCVVVGCQADEIDDLGRIVGHRIFPQTDAAIRWQMAFGCPMLHPALMYRREVIVAAGGYVADMWPAEDYDVWIRVSQLGKLANLPETLMKYRVHSSSVTLTHTHRQIAMCAQLGAKYVTGLCSEIDESAMRGLWLFLGYGVIPTAIDIDALAETFAALKDYFLGSYGNEERELRERIRATQTMLRWRCVERVESLWRSPRVAWRWLRLAGRFDPDEGTVRKMARRALRKLLTNRTPTAQ
jgi:GT2 family glycosyltransferase